MNSNRNPVAHGDVKPQNILLSGGSVLLGDLGLARSLRPDRPTRHSGNLTVAFAPPEYFDGIITPFSDQYSLAATWHFLRTGQVPLGGPDSFSSGSGASIFSGLPVEEQAVLARSMKKIPSARYPSCGRFVTALERAEKRFRRWQKIVGLSRAVAALLAIALGVFLSWFLFVHLPQQFVTRHERRGKLALASGDWETANASFSKAIKEHPHSVNALNGRASARIELGWLNEAVDDLVRAEKVEKTDPTNAEIPYQFGVIAARRERAEEALEAFSRAIELNPDRSKYYLARGEIFAMEGKNHAALADFNRAIQREPANDTALAARSRVQDNFDAALSDLTAALRIAPHHAPYFLQRAILFMEHQDDTLALADTTAALRLDPMMVMAYLLRAEIYDRMGQPDKATEEMENALRARK